MIPEFLLLAATTVLVFGGVLCGLLGRRPALANRMGPIVAVLGAIPAAWAAGQVLWTGQTAAFSIPWSVPFGSLSLSVDGLSAYFMLAIAAICALAAIYGGPYLASSLGRRNVGAAWFFYNLLFASMLIVVSAANGIVFLVAWEIMSLASFFLVMFEHDRPEVRQAGWTYLVATHLGTAFLLALFVLLSGGGASMDFAKFISPGSPAAAGAMFLLAVVGFGTKAGFVPLHVWLPEAHPAAPSHVSAVMSGVMIKTGIYGLLRTLSVLGPPPAWWGWTLIGIGVVSGVGGVLLAVAQRDIKRLLAYSSVENIGLIALGLGLWQLGLASGNAALATLGLLGALLHVWNHAIFKSLLFLGAGAVVHAAGTRDMERLGGLFRRAKHTAAFVLIGSVAICALPPLNGFAGEFLLYLGALTGITAGKGHLMETLGGLSAVAALATIGGLAIACFAKMFGVVFLGEPRSDVALHAHEAPRGMLVPMGVMAWLCILLGMISPLVVRVAAGAAGPMLPDAQASASIAQAQDVLWIVAGAGATLIALTAAFWMIRRRLLAGRPVERAVTWDCGYAAPNARMQYTGSSFTWPIVGMFRWLLRPQVRHRLPEGLFPAAAEVESNTDDVVRRFGYGPLFTAVGWLADRLRWLQQGRNQLYVLYIALTLLILLLWKLG